MFLFSCIELDCQDKGSINSAEDKLYINQKLTIYYFINGYLRIQPQRSCGTYPY